MSYLRNPGIHELFNDKTLNLGKHFPMSTAELRNKLIEKILAVDDEFLLEEAGRLFEIEGSDAEVYTLSASQKAAIDAARKQIAAGNYFTDEEVNREIDEWLNKFRMLPN